MEAILFYGDQDEATRRQVRSVAAQYSHRIGPRKRKKSKAPKPTEIIESKRGHYKKLAATASDVAATSSGSKRGQRRPNAVTSNQQNVPRVLVHPKPGSGQPIQSQQHGHKEHLLGTETSDPETCASSSEIGSEPAHSPHTPQFGFLPSIATAPSPDKPVSPYRRLPAYTWTEYPRYAVAQVGFTTPSHALPVAPGNRLAYELPDPTACLGGYSKQNPPRSHPVDLPPSPRQLCADSLRVNQPLPQPLHHSRTHGVTNDAVPFAQLTAQPPLQVLRCAQGENIAGNGEESRWRSGSEYHAAENLRRMNTPG